jgi:site-specific DNA recombinase
MKKDMEPIADLYIRVSTDEQADKGYSQRNQEEMLRKYCDSHAIEIRDAIYEDHSAKSFNRPGWKRMLAQLKKHRNKIDFIFFTKWDRFSRNAGDAYQMINILRELGVEPQAIEQPLDLSIPENKMMLAFYLAAPEVENDRRALNVLYGMRRAKKEGRYMGLAPVGYKNKVDEGGNKYISPKEPEASILVWAFEQLAKGEFNTEQIWKKVRDKGLMCSKNAFWQAIRNPVYCGKIFIPEFGDEGSYFAKGQHQSVISEQLYKEVQKALDGRGRSYRSKLETKEEFPLRGLLACPRCGRLLTASKSKGRNKYYAYYHCSHGCPHRISIEDLNHTFQVELSRYVPRKEIFDVFRSIVIETYYDLTKEAQLAKKQILTQLKVFENKMSHTRDLLAEGKIDAADYHDIKAQYSSSLNQLNEKLKEVNSRVPGIDDLLAEDASKLLELDEIIQGKNNEDIRAMVSMLYPEKLIFHGRTMAPVKVNDAIIYAYQYLPK